MTPPWQIREHIGQTGLDELRADWLRLTGEMPHSGFAHDFEAHRAYFKHLSPSNSDFRFLALTDGSRVRAICPVEVTSQVLWRRPSRVWGLAPARINGFSLDVICPEDEARREFLPQVMRHLAAIRDSPSWLAFDRVLEGSVLWDCLKFLDQGRHCIEANGASSILDCTRAYDLVASAFSSNHRQSRRKSRRRLAERGQSRFESAATQPRLDQMFEQFLDIEASGWKGESGARGALRFHPDQLAFYRELVSALGSLGRCEIQALEVDGRAIGSKICFRCGSEFSGFKTCYDERESALTPGFLLSEYAIERCCEDPGIARYNFVSHYDWHLGFRPTVIPAYSVYIPLHAYAGSLWTQLLRLRHRHGAKLGRLLRWLRGKRP